MYFTSCVKKFLPAVNMDSRFLASNRPILLALLYLSCALVSLTVAQSAKTPAPPTACADPTGGKSTCVCQTSAGQTIDLRPLSKTDGTAKFTGIQDDQGYSYDYNPCTHFSDGTEKACAKVFMCQTLPAKKLIYDVADDSEQIYLEPSTGKYYVQYSGPEQRETKVYLNCNHKNHDGTITSLDSSTSNHYVLQLESCHACPGGCGGGGGVPPGIVGIVLIIVIIISLVAYFIIGALLMKFHFQASGSDVVPNKAFWIQLPLLIKDGFVFTFGPCFKCIGEKTGMRNDYQKI